MNPISFNDLNGKVCVITGGAGVLGTAMVKALASVGLKIAIADINKEVADSVAAEIAKEEGFDKIAQLFESVAAIEKHHEERYRKLLKNVQDKVVFSKDGDCIWQCRNCGHIVVGKNAPEVCPVCAHPQSYFQVKPENY